MQEIRNNFTIPRELTQYYNTRNNALEEECNFSSNVKSERDKTGKLLALKIYSPDNELIKSLHYDGSKISEVNNYRQNLIYSTSNFSNDLLIRKTIYKKDGSVAYSIDYEYNKDNHILRMCKKTQHSNPYRDKWGVIG